MVAGMTINEKGCLPWLSSRWLLGLDFLLVSATFRTLVSRIQLFGGSEVSQVTLLFSAGCCYYLSLPVLSAESLPTQEVSCCCPTSACQPTL